MNIFPIERAMALEQTENKKEGLDTKILMKITDLEKVSHNAADQQDRLIKE